MSQQYDDKNTGALFVNAQKKTDKHPDFNGVLNVEGKDYWLSGWKNKMSDKSRTPGMGYVGLKIKPKEDSASPQGQQNQTHDGFEF